MPTNFAWRICAVSFIFALFFIVNPQNSKAISNACLNHSGINCSAGPSPYGYARCNDNTTSPILYQLAECSSDEASGCVAPKLSGCISRPQLDDIRNALNRYTYECQASSHQLNNIYADCNNFSLQRQLQICQSELNEYEIQGQIYGNCVRDYYKNILNNTSSTYNIQKQKEEKACAAKSGYVWDSTNNKCVGTDLFCQSSFGKNSHVINSSDGRVICSCNDGFVRNSGNTECARKTISSQTSSSVQMAGKLTVNFGLGAYSNDVVILQKFLASKGFLKIPTGMKTGYFGTQTQKALADFQRSAGLPATGYCGPLTRAAINNPK